MPDAKSIHAGGVLEVYEKFAETFLYHIWDEGHFDSSNLQTTDGHRVEIVFRGRWNLDSGPDFRGALLKIAGTLVKGDIELHLRENDWFQHNHHQDPRYDNVILHVVMWESARPAPAVTVSGRIVPTLVLSRYFDESVSRLQVRYLRAEKHEKWPAVCLVRRMSSEKKFHLLEHWGLVRLREKRDRFLEQRNIFSFDELIYQGISEALGYSKNQRPFLKLSFMVPFGLVNQLSLERPGHDLLHAISALLFGAAGFLEMEETQKSSLPAENRAFVESLLEEWRELRERYRLTPMSQTEWQFFRLRPANFPSLRIAALAALLARFQKTGFLDPLLNLFRDLGKRPARLHKELERLFSVENYGFWRTHFRLDGESRSRFSHSARLIGGSLAREIIVNVVIPAILAYASETEDRSLEVAVRRLYLSGPLLQKNSLLRRVARQIGLESRPISACQQQGMIYLGKSLCPRWHCQVCVRGDEL